MPADVRDRERLRRLFGGDDAAWIRRRLRDRYERQGSFPTRVSLRSPNEKQRELVGRLFGRMPARGQSLTVDVGRLENALRDAGLGSVSISPTPSRSSMARCAIGERSERRARGAGRPFARRSAYGSVSVHGCARGSTSW